MDQIKSIEEQMNIYESKVIAVGAKNNKGITNTPS